MAQMDRDREVYFVQLLIIANIVFPLVFGRSPAGDVCSTLRSGSGGKYFCSRAFFGFYQEVVCRGILQSVLVSRCGVFIGI